MQLCQTVPKIFSLANSGVYFGSTVCKRRSWQLADVQMYTFQVKPSMRKISVSRSFNETPMGAGLYVKARCIITRHFVNILLHQCSVVHCAPVSIPAEASTP